MILGGIEAGGTKFVCAVGSSTENLTSTQFSTTHPEETLEKVVRFLKPYKSQLQAIGIGSFGPLGLAVGSSTYGYITSTPKPGWANIDFVGEVKSHFNLPIAFDTDVNVAALGELRQGAGRGVENLIYLTLGTGVGGGIIANGSLIHGMVHPEMGHIFLPKHPEDTFEGSCPFHNDQCFEGLASGPAMQARWGQAAENLGENHPAWELEADYIAKALVSFICTLSPEKIIIGGGLSQNQGLLHRIKHKTQEQLAGYIRSEFIENDLDNYIVLPALGTKSGVVGALELAHDLALRKK